MSVCYFDDFYWIYIRIIVRSDSYPKQTQKNIWKQLETLTKDIDWYLTRIEVKKASKVRGWNDTKIKW